jgi:hypothetical protein
MPLCQFLFSAIFVFQKSYTDNILGIGRNKNRSSYFADTKTESKGQTEKGQEAATPGGGAGPWATPPCDVAVAPIHNRPHAPPHDEAVYTLRSDLYESKTSRRKEPSMPSAGVSTMYLGS